MTEGDRPEVIPNAEGERTTPSIVSIDPKTKEVLVGSLAKRQAALNPKNTFLGTKRLIGRKFIDEETTRHSKLVSYEVCESPNGNGDAWIYSPALGKKIPPAQVGAYILMKLKNDAEAYLGKPVTECVITVPAYFNDEQRQATKDAGKLAGMKVLRVINEPTAAALAYGYGQTRVSKDNNTKAIPSQDTKKNTKKKNDKQKTGDNNNKGSNEPETIAVFDLGGGTFDLSVLTLHNDTFEVRSTAGDTFLGGDDFDRISVEKVVDSYHKQYKVIQGSQDSLYNDASALARIREAAEQAKKELSNPNKKSALINIPFISTGPDGVPRHLEYSLSKEEFNKNSEPLLRRLDKPVLRALNDAGVEVKRRKQQSEKPESSLATSSNGVNPKEISSVLLVGGMTRVPCVREYVNKIFNGSNSKFNTGMKVKDKNSVYVNTGINPDECVAVGAAVQCGILSNSDENSLLLVDVTPLSLGVDTEGGIFARIVNRGTQVPVKRTQTFTTSQDNQTVVNIDIYQGERDLSAHNLHLGHFKLEVPPLPRGAAQIEVTFDIDADGIVHVTATDKKTGVSRSLSVRPTTDDLQSLMDEQENSLENKKEKELIQKWRSALGRARSITGAAKSTILEHAKVPISLKTSAEDKITQIEELINTSASETGLGEHKTISQTESIRILEKRIADLESLTNALQVDNLKMADSLKNTKV